VWRGSTTRLDISDIDLRGRYAAIMDLPYIDLRGRYRASRGVYWRRRASEMKMYSFAFPSPALPTEGAGSQKPVFNALRSLAQGWIASHRVNAL